MLSAALLREDYRENRKLLWAFSAVLVFFALLNVGLYSWASGRLGANVFMDVPTPLRKLLGLEMTDHSLTAFLGKTLYECWFMGILLLFELILSRRLIANQIEKRTMIYYIGSPLGRERVIYTQGYFLIVSVMSLIFFSAVMTILMAGIFFPGQLEIPQFLLFNVGFFFLHLTLSGIGFFFSCAGKNRVQVYAGAAIALLCMILYILGKTVEGLWVCRYLSVVSLYEINELLYGKITLLIRLLLLFLIGGGLYWLGWKIFCARDLHLAGKHQNSKGV